jgi:uncharacterized delta-60 repeat protein
MGRTGSFGAGGSDFWVLKLDAAGEVDWQKTYGGSDQEHAYSIQQTSDGGYIVTGSTESFGAGLGDFWVLKLDAAGDVDWQKTYGEYNPEGAWSIQQTADDGFIVAGVTSSFGAGLGDFWVLKLDAAGDVDWQKTYGGTNTETAYFIQQTADDGFIVAGYTSSFGAGGLDFWVLKLDAAGDVDWQKTYGGSGNDDAFSIQQTSDNGYIITGRTNSFGAGGYDFWVLKLDAAGDVDWQKTYGGSDEEHAYSIQQTSDGGFIVAGYTFSFGAGGYDFWVLKLNPDGSIDPSCSPDLGADSTAIPASTSVTPATSTATVVDSAATITDTSVTPADSSATVQTQCESAYETYEFVAEWGTYGTGDGELRNPTGIAIDSSGDIYVADSENNRIQKFTSDGTFLAKWGTYGTGDGEFFKPAGIAVDGSGDIYVTDMGNHRVQKFTSDGTFLAKWGTYGTGDGEFNDPRGIAVDSSGDIYVADTGNDRIQKFTSDGTFLAKWGSSGTLDGEFGYPEGIAIDSSGYIYVVERFNERIQKFTSIGTFVAKWGTYGTGDGEFYAPSGIAIDSSGDIYAADMGNYRIQKFTSDGTFVTKWGTYGTGEGQFDLPYEIAVDSSGYVYVTDCWNHRIQKFQKQ